MLAVAVSSLWGLSSCEEHTDIYDRSIKVGSVLLSDNTVITPSGYDRKEHLAVGIVFYVNRDTALVVGLKELGSWQFSDSLGTVTSVVNDAYSKCGMENTAAIMASDIHSPAVEAVRRYTSPVSGWALPSAGELRALAAMLSVVENSMRIIGGEPFDDGQYLSSTQDGSTSESEQMYYLSVAVRSGFVTSTIKTTPGRVRPVLRVR
jgi:hypothetical protein